ncbi:MAG: hypothetical protein K0R41_3604, partial [Geminicoccaceae bacterium]|nr:hypothetical protein [Geminicoccaceae bacterium]
MLPSGAPPKPITVTGSPDLPSTRVSLACMPASLTLPPAPYAAARRIATGEPLVSGQPVTIEVALED